MIMLLSIGYKIFKLNKTEIRNLKIENWCMVFLDVWILVSVKTWYFKCWLLLVECIGLKYQRLTKMRTTLKLSHQNFIQHRLFVGLDLYFLKMLHVWFYLKLKLSNWQNTACFCVSSCTSWFAVCHHASG